jgi:hypothetical protein
MFFSPAVGFVDVAANTLPPRENKKRLKIGVWGF